MVRIKRTGKSGCGSPFVLGKHSWDKKAAQQRTHATTLARLQVRQSPARGVMDSVDARRIGARWDQEPEVEIAA